MPRFEITAPSGQKFEITSPEGATQDQVLAYAQGQFGQQRPSAAEQIASDPITQAANRTLMTSPAELAAANPIVRALTTAALPIQGAAAILEAPFGGTSSLDRIRQLHEMQARGAEQLGFGPAATLGQDIGGSMIGPMTGVALKAPAAATAMGRIAQGAGIGALAGETSMPEAPMTGATIGGATGAAIPAAIEGGKALGRGTLRLLDLFRGNTGARNILDRYLSGAIGEQNVPTVAAKLRAGAAEPVPGYQPTAAEAVAGLPEGSPLVAHQRIVASTPGGPSAAFGNRIIDQKQALADAAAARDATIVPALKQSLATADQTGIKSQDIINGIDQQLQTPGFRASSVVKKTLDAVKEKVDSLSANGVINGEDLWTVRKEIGNMITSYSKETANWDKRLTSALQGKIQSSIDDAIVKAGGTDWPANMAEYAAQSQAIQAAKDTAKAAMRPGQRTDLFGGLRVAEETRAHVPQLLSRPMMIANAILRYFSSGIEPKIDTLATQRYLNPAEFADALDRLPKPTQSQVVEAMKRVGVANAVLQVNKGTQPQQAPAQ